MANLTKTLERKIRKKLAELGSDTYDLIGNWDSSLTIGENLKELGMGKVDFDETIESKNEKNKAEFLQMATKHEEKEFEKRIAEIKRTNVDIDIKQYETLKKITRTLLNSKKINSFIVVGKRGIGKTYNIISELEKKKKKYTLIKGHITPFLLYDVLYEHRNGGLVMFDDIPQLLKDENALSLLLSAMDYDYKNVRWLTKQDIDIPSEFVFNGRVILCLNEITQNREFVEALKDRAFYYKLEISVKQMFEIMYAIAKKRNMSLEVVDYLKEIYKPYMENFSLRLLEKAWRFYKTNPEKWKGLLAQVIEQNDVKKLICECDEHTLTVKDAVAEFCRITGQSRATYFRYKNKITKQELVKVKV